MTPPNVWTPDPKLDLVLDRFIDVPPELVFRAWTTPEHVCQWFCPKPWRVTECEIDLRPGGRFFTRMRGPAGEDFPNVGCWLEIVPNRRLVWTDALQPGWRPAENPFMTGIITMEPEGKGTRYVATAIHRDAATRKKHEEMGFHDGWGKACDQLVEFAKTL